MKTLDQYRGMLRIDRNRLDDELEVQAEMQEQIGRMVAQLQMRANEAKEKLARVEGIVLDDIRDANPKLTVDQVKGRALRDTDRQAAFRAHQDALLTLGEWEALLAAWVTKGYKLADMGGLYASDYFAVRTVTRNETRRSLQPDEDARRALRDASANHQRERVKL